LSLPEGFETVTFHDKFHGQSFAVFDGVLATDLPWPPGQRQIKFTYRIPIERRHSVLQRRLDLPCTDLVVHVDNDVAENVSCNVPKHHEPGRTVFQYTGAALPVGYTIELQLAHLPVSIMSYAPWIATGLLIALLAGTAIPLYLWRTPARQVTANRQTKQVRGRGAKATVSSRR
jgi:hypothetical protein